MRGPMIVLAALCLAVGLLGGLALKAAQPVLQSQMGGVIPADAQAWLDVAWTILWKVSLGGFVVMGLAAGLAILRRRLLAGRSIESAGTWDCGYVAPTARMQYTASSFGWPIVTLFRWLLRPAMRDRRPEGLFPSAAGVQSRDRDIFEHWGYRPIFGLADWLSGRLQWLQQGRNQLYILYIAMTLLVLLVWKLG
jgi:hydrogenase-4 component B